MNLRPIALLAAVVLSVASTAPAAAQQAPSFPDRIDLVGLTTRQPSPDRPTNEVQFHTTVTGAAFDEARDQWRVSTDSGEITARYLINAGRLDPTSWYLNEELEGSRFAGEGGHFIDTVSALTGQHPVEVHALGTGANVTATLRFADDSVATISYLTDGSPRFAKETLDVLGDGRVGRLDNFQRVSVWTSKGKNGRRVLAGQDKGHAAQLKRFIEAVRTDAAMPIALESLVATTRATLAVGTSLATSKPVTL